MRADEGGFVVAAAERDVEAEGGSEDGGDEEVDGVVPVLGRRSGS